MTWLRPRKTVRWSVKPSAGIDHVRAPVWQTAVATVVSPTFALDGETDVNPIAQELGGDLARRAIEATEDGVQAYWRGCVVGRGADARKVVELLGEQFDRGVQAVCVGVRPFERAFVQSGGIGTSVELPGRELARRHDSELIHVRVSDAPRTLELMVVLALGNLSRESLDDA